IYFHVGNFTVLFCYNKLTIKLPVAHDSHIINICG
ncbi:hypothetical protein AZZ60_003787, partial [Escherichia coli]